MPPPTTATTSRSAPIAAPSLYSTTIASLGPSSDAQPEDPDRETPSRHRTALPARRSRRRRSALSNQPPATAGRLRSQTFPTGRNHSTRLWLRAPAYLAQGRPSNAHTYRGCRPNRSPLITREKVAARNNRRGYRGAGRARLVGAHRAVRRLERRMLLLNAKSRGARGPRVLSPARRHARVPQPRWPLAFADCECLEPLALGSSSGRRPSALTRGRRTPASAGGSNRPTSPT